MRTPIVRRAALAVAATAVVATSACSTSLDKLPLPAPGLGGQTYQLTATFSNALNLPTKAKVKLNGADIGEVESMVAKNYTAVVHMRIRAGVVLPAGATAELRSATPMGDVFVAVTPPAHPDPDGGTLGDGASIPLSATSAAATIEEVLTKASLLVNGGAIESVTKVANSLGAELGGRGDRLADIITETRHLVDTLAARSGEIRAVLTDADALGRDLAARQSAIGDAVAAAGPALSVVGDNTQNIVDLVGRLNAITQQLALFPSIKGTNDRSLMALVNLLAADLNDAALNPNASLDPLIGNLSMIPKLLDAQSAHINVDLPQLALGALPDPNFPGDPGARLPDVTDWNSFVGSLQYSLNELRAQAIGPHR